MSTKCNDRRTGSY